MNEWQEYVASVLKKDTRNFKLFDNGPWEVREFDDGIVLFSDDFHHDVTLEISGDFGGDEVQRPYMEALCYFLNNANCVPKDIPPKEIDNE